MTIANMPSIHDDDNIIKITHHQIDGFPFEILPESLFILRLWCILYECECICIVI